MSKVHHVHDRSAEHAKTRDTMAHRLITPHDVVRSTRGFAAVKGSQPALDVQPRHGGKAKGGVVAHSWGNTEQQVAKENTAHIVTEAVDASSENPLDLMTSSQAGKHLPIPACNSATPSRAGRGVFDSAVGDKVIGQAIISGSDKLPGAVSEE